MLALGDASQTACPCREGIASTLCSPTHRRGLGISAGGLPVPSCKGSAGLLDAPQALGSRVQGAQPGGRGP